MIACLVHAPSPLQAIASALLVGVIGLGATALFHGTEWGPRRRDCIASGLIALALAWHRLEVVRNDCFGDFWRYNVADLQFLSDPIAESRVLRGLALPAGILLLAWVISRQPRRSRLPTQQ